VRPGGVALDDVGGEPALPERSGDAEPRDAGADHENAQTGAVASTGVVSHPMSVRP
jgi:hypothetical protein